jgi:hypothetical protein
LIKANADVLAAATAEKFRAIAPLAMADAEVDITASQLIPLCNAASELVAALDDPPISYTTAALALLVVEEEISASSDACLLSPPLTEDLDAPAPANP